MTRLRVRLTVAVVVLAVLLAWRFWQLLAVPAAVVIGLVLITAGTRFVLAPNEVKQNYPAAILARLRWRWLVRNLHLGWRDLHVTDKRNRNRGADLKGAGSYRVRYPRARIRPTAHGVTARVRTIPGTGRREFEDSARHIADAWLCARVQVVQERPGRIVLHGLRRDPLAEPFGADGAPAGTFSAIGTGILSTCRNNRLYLGRDAGGDHRWLQLAGVTGVTVAGLPGYGKSSLINSFLCQLAPSNAVRFALIDGKGGADLEPWRGRAWLYAEDDLAAALAVLEDVHAEMRRRLGSVLELTGGKRNAWHVGPTSEMPLLVTVVDECQTFLDVAARKGDQAREAMARRCATLAGELVRKGRSVLMLSVLSTQKPTSDSLPTSIRDNCGLGISFGLKTKDGAVAALGEGIREFASYCPTSLRDPSMVGVCSATLPTGTDPYCLLRVPEITEEWAAARAAACVCPPSLTPDGVTV